MRKIYLAFFTPVLIFPFFLISCNEDSSLAIYVNKNSNFSEYDNDADKIDANATNDELLVHIHTDGYITSKIHNELYCFAEGNNDDFYWKIESATNKTFTIELWETNQHDPGPLAYFDLSVELKINENNDDFSNPIDEINFSINLHIQD